MNQQIVAISTFFKIMSAPSHINTAFNVLVFHLSTTELLIHAIVPLHNLRYAIQGTNVVDSLYCCLEQKCHRDVPNILPE